MYPVPDKSEDLNSYQEHRRFYTGIDVTFQLRFWLQNFSESQDYSKMFNVPMMRIRLTGTGRYQTCMPHDAPLVVNGESFSLSEVSKNKNLFVNSFIRKEKVTNRFF